MESFGVNFNTITPFQKDFRFLPVHEESGCFASVLAWRPEAGKKGVVEINTALLSPSDTTLIQFVSAHELGHFISKKEFLVTAPVIEEGLANWGGLEVY